MSQHAPLSERFWANADKRGPDECWLWTAGRYNTGYGYFDFDRRRYSVHRLSYEMSRGEPIPAKLCVCHSCDKPLCVNPAHLWLGTDADNHRDAIAKGRHSSQIRWRDHNPSHCGKGHPLTADNLGPRTGGRPRCRTCQRASQRRYKQKAKVQAASSSRVSA